MKNTIFKKSLLSIAVLSFASLYGCTVIPGVKDTLDEGAQTNKRATNSFKKSIPLTRQSVIEHHDSAWLLGKELTPFKSPPAYMTKQVFFERGGSVRIEDIANWIQQNAGVPVDVDPSVYFKYPLKMPGMSSASGSMGMMGGSGGASSVKVTPKINSPYYSGNMEGFLSYVAEENDIYWKLTDNGHIRFFKTETKTFYLPSIPSVTSSSGSISTQGGSSGGGSTAGGGATGGATGGASAGGATAGGASGGSSGSGGGTTTMSTTTNLDYWKDLSKTANEIAGVGATVVVDQNVGTITVTGTPVQMERTESWVKNLSAIFSKQIGIDVHVYNVQLNHEDNYGVNLVDKFANWQGPNLGFTLTGAPVPTVISGATPMSFGASIVQSNSPASGSTAAVTALSTLGKVSQEFSRAGVTLNGRMLALQSANIQNYLASSTSMLASNVGSSVTLMPGSVVTGFTGTFLPKVVDNKVYIDLNLTISNLLALTTFTSGTGSNASTIQLPQVSSTTIEQIVGMKPGDTLVLTGYRQRNDASNQNGTITPTNPLFGGGVEANQNDSIVAIVVTAKLL